MKTATRHGSEQSESDVLDLDELYRAALLRNRRKHEHAPSPRYPAKALFSTRTAIAAVVISGHAAVFWVLASIGATSEHPSAVAPDLRMVPLIRLHRVAHTLPLPEVHFASPVPDEASITFINFHDPDAGVVSGVTAPASAPRLDPTATVDSKPYALRAGLVAGNAVTVVLAIEVLEDGSAGDITVTSSAGDSAIDAAAIDYVRALRWIPGTVDRRARAMRINFSLTLATPA